MINYILAIVITLVLFGGFWIILNKLNEVEKLSKEFQEEIKEELRTLKSSR